MGLSDDFIGAKVVATLDAGGGKHGLVLIDWRGRIVHTLRLSEFSEPEAGLVVLAEERLSGVAEVGAPPAPLVAEIAPLQPRKRRRALAAPRAESGSAVATDGAARECGYCGAPVERKAKRKGGGMYCNLQHYWLSKKGKALAYRRRAKGEDEPAAPATVSPDGFSPVAGRMACEAGSHHWLVEALAGGIDRYTCQRPGCAATKELPEAKTKSSWSSARDRKKAAEVAAVDG